MSAAIGIGLASMGNAFLKTSRENDERDRRRKIEDEDRAFREEERAVVRDQRATQKKINTEMSDAMAPRATMEGTVTDAGDGKLLSADAEQAEFTRKTLADEAELAGKAAPAQQAGSAVTGSMSKGHEIMPGATRQDAAGEAKDQNSPDARNERAVGVMRANGQWKEAMAMENAIMDQKAKRMGLQVAEYQFLDQQTNREMMETLRGAKTWWDGAADFITTSKSGAIKDFKAEAKLSEDGQTVEMFAVKPDGTRQSTGSYPASDAGLEQFLTKFGAVPLDARLRILADSRKEARADKKDVQDQANKDRDFGLRQRESENNVDYKNRMLGLQYSQERRAQETHAATMQDSKIPPAVKMEAATLAKQIESIGTALNKSMAEGMFDPNNEGTKRLLERQAALGIQYSKVITPYRGGGAGGPAASADPLGFNAPAPAAPGAARPAAAAPRAAPAQMPAAPSADNTRVSPQAQAERDRDAVPILQAELAQAQQRAAGGDPRAQADVQAIQSELARMGIKAPASAPVAQQPSPQAAPMVNMGGAAPAAAQPAQAAQPVNMQAVAPAAPQVSPVAQALAGPSASPAVAAQAQQRAVVVEALASEVKAGQAAVVQAAKTGDQNGIKAAMDHVAAASAKLRESLKGMNPQQAALVIRAAGLQ